LTPQLSDSKPLINIFVETFGENGVMEKVQLTAEIWQWSLIPGLWRDAFLPPWDEYNRVRNAREAIFFFCHLRSQVLRKLVRAFVHDLRTFGGDKGSRQRLEGTGHEFYLGSPYFSTSTREKLLKIPTKNGTLETDLRALSDKRRGGEICAAHDLSPLFEAILAVSWDKSRN